MTKRSEAVGQAIIDAWQEGSEDGTSFEAGVISGLANITEQLSRIADHLSGESGESEAGAGVPVDDRDHSTEPAPLPLPVPVFVLREGVIRVDNPNGDSSGERGVLLHAHQGIMFEWVADDGSEIGMGSAPAGSMMVKAPLAAVSGRTRRFEEIAYSEWYPLPPIPGAS